MKRAFQIVSGVLAIVAGVVVLLLALEVVVWDEASNRIRTVTESALLPFGSNSKTAMQLPDGFVSGCTDDPLLLAACEAPTKYANDRGAFDVNNTTPPVEASEDLLRWPSCGAKPWPNSKNTERTIVGEGVTKLAIDDDSGCSRRFTASDYSTDEFVSAESRTTMPTCRCEAQCKCG